MKPLFQKFFMILTLSYRPDFLPACFSSFWLAMKFLMASFDENTIETVLKPDYIDCCLGSPNIIVGFLKLIMDNWGLQSSGALSYMKSIGDLLDYRKANSVTDNV